MICEYRTWAATTECPNRNGHCGTLQSAYVYGLYDPRIDDMFYVGSTIWPARRYSDHMHSSAACNFREAWIMAILAAGSQPLFCSLYEFKTACELEIKATEREIARALRSRGHTALSDDVMYPHNQGRYAWRYEIGKRWDFLEQIIGEYLDLVNEQARIVQWLRSF